MDVLLPNNHGDDNLNDNDIIVGIGISFIY